MLDLTRDGLRDLFAQGVCAQGHYLGNNLFFAPDTEQNGVYFNESGSVEFFNGITLCALPGVPRGLQFRQLSLHVASLTLTVDSFAPIRLQLFDHKKQRLCELEERLEKLPSGAFVERDYVVTVGREVLNVRKGQYGDEIVWLGTERPAWPAARHTQRTLYATSTPIHEAVQRHYGHKMMLKTRFAGIRCILGTIDTHTGCQRLYQAEVEPHDDDTHNTLGGEYSLARYCTSRSAIVDWTTWTLYMPDYPPLRDEYILSAQFDESVPYTLSQLGSVKDMQVTPHGMLLWNDWNCLVSPPLHLQHGKSIPWQQHHAPPAPDRSMDDLFRVVHAKTFTPATAAETQFCSLLTRFKPWFMSLRLPLYFEWQRVQLGLHPRSLTALLDRHHQCQAKLPSQFHMYFAPHYYQSRLNHSSALAMAYLMRYLHLCGSTLTCEDVQQKCGDFLRTGSLGRFCRDVPGTVLSANTLLPNAEIMTRDVLVVGQRAAMDAIQVSFRAMPKDTIHEGASVQLNGWNCIADPFYLLEVGFKYNPFSTLSREEATWDGDTTLHLIQVGIYTVDILRGTVRHHITKNLYIHLYRILSLHDPIDDTISVPGSCSATGLAAHFDTATWDLSDFPLIRFGSHCTVNVLAGTAMIDDTPHRLEYALHPQCEGVGIETGDGTKGILSTTNETYFKGTRVYMEPRNATTVGVWCAHNMTPLAQVQMDIYWKEVQINGANQRMNVFLIGLNRQSVPLLYQAGRQDVRLERIDDVIHMHLSSQHDMVCVKDQMVLGNCARHIVRNITLCTDGSCRSDGFLLPIQWEMVVTPLE